MKLILENWRKYLNEGAGATVGQFIDYIQKINRDIAGQEAASSAANFGLGLTGYGQIQNAEQFMKALKVAIGYANSGELTNQDYSENPFLVYLDFDENYEKVVHPKVFEDFLNQLEEQLSGEGYSTSSPMPDIDILLELYIFQKYGVRLDGATEAGQEFDAYANIHSYVPSTGAKKLSKLVGKSVIDPLRKLDPHIYPRISGKKGNE